MKVLACGGRTFADRKTVDWALSAYLNKAEPYTLCIIEGGAPGADTLARQWAERNKCIVMEFPANWTYLGRSAGSKRNQAMLDWGQPDTVVAFPGGPGTADMVRRAKARKINVVEIVP
jgi:hypothetical protein